MWTGDLDAAMLDFNDSVKLESKKPTFFLARARSWLDRHKTGRAFWTSSTLSGLTPITLGFP